MFFMSLKLHELFDISIEFLINPHTSTKEVTDCLYPVERNLLINGSQTYFGLVVSNKKKEVNYERKKNKCKAQN